MKYIVKLNTVTENILYVSEYLPLQ